MTESARQFIRHHVEGKPTVCAIDGPAVGMGAEFTSQCDLRLASPGARFAWNFVHRGLVPDTGAGTWLLPRCGVLGYVLDVVPQRRLWCQRAIELAGAIAAGSPHSLGLIKSLVQQGLTAPVDEHMQRHTAAMAACFKSDDHREGVAAFLERRPAEFTGGQGAVPSGGPPMPLDSCRQR